MDNNKKRIMVVDDEPGITRMLKRNLEATGCYEVCAVNSAMQALGAAQQFRPDLILLDVMMPQKDGGALAGEIKADSTLAHTPVVFLTAAATKQEVSNHGRKIGGETFIAKPVDLKEVIECIEENLAT